MPGLERDKSITCVIDLCAGRFWLETPDGAPVAAVASGKEADFLTMLIEGDAHAASHHR